MWHSKLSKIQDKNQVETYYSGHSELFTPRLSADLSQTHLGTDACAVLSVGPSFLFVLS